MIRSLIALALILFLIGSSAAIAFDVCRCGKGHDGVRQASHQCCHGSASQTIKNACGSHNLLHSDQAVEPTRLGAKLKEMSVTEPVSLQQFHSDLFYQKLTQIPFFYFGEFPNQAITPLRL